MGWDVDAIYDDHRRGYVNTEDDAVAANAFRSAAERAIQICGSVDGFLENGGLDVSSCVHVLASLAGEQSKVAIWTSGQVKQHWESIQWPDVSQLSDSERWPVVSAREFLRVCAENGYGVRFDP